MLASARQRAWRMAGVCALLPARGGFVGRAISPAAGPLRHRRVSGTMQASPPTGAGQGPAGPCRIFLPQTGNAPLRLRPAAHPPPLAGEALGELPFERLPCKGLRSRAPPAADTARWSRCRGRRMQACFGMRRMMRVPQTGNVGVSRRRGAAPCRANTLPGWRKSPRRAFTPAGEGGGGGRVCGGRNRPPYNAPACGRQHRSGSRTSGPTVGRRRDHPFAQGPAGLPFPVPPPVCRVL